MGSTYLLGPKAVALLLVLLMAGSFLALIPFAASAQAPVHITLTSPNPEVSGEFGWSVAIGGNVAVAGAPGETVGGDLSAGNAYLFNTATGAHIATLTSPNSEVGGEFGYSVATNGSVVIVGAPFETVSGNANAGRVYVFNVATGRLMWTLTSPHSQAGGEFGWSVAMSEETIVIGAPLENNGLEGGGYVYIFNAVTGTPHETLTETGPPGCTSTDEFGFSVGASGSTVVVGEPGIDVYCDTGPNGGLAYTFNAATGALLAEYPPSPSYNDGSAYFGDAVAISGNAAVIGSPGYESANIFNAQTGAPVAGLTPGQGSGQYGASVAISGDNAIVGAFEQTANGNSYSGNAFVFNVATGVESAMLTSPNSQVGGGFGYSVAIYGNTEVVGAYYESAGGYAGAGHAYIFNPPTPPPVDQPIKLTVASLGKSTTVTLSGCSVSPTSISANGVAHVVKAKPDCTITVHLPVGSTTRYVSSPNGAVTTLPIKTCASSTCPTASHTVYQEFKVVFAVKPLGHGTTIPSGINWYDKGYTRTIKANPAMGHRFIKWSSSTALTIIPNPTKATTTATIDGAGTITATFT
jgi:hypothetical protein